MRAADELIDCIVNSSQIPSRKRRREIQRELRSHIEDFVVAAREAGRGQDEIERLVLANFGDPGQIAQGFAWVYRHERRRLRAFAFTLSTVLLASCLLAAILAMQAGLAFGFGTPIMNVLASRHTVIEALDILASVAVYLGLTSLENLFESHRFQKAAFLLTVILTILMVSCAAAGWHDKLSLFWTRQRNLLSGSSAICHSEGRACRHRHGLFSAGRTRYGSAAVAGFTCCPRRNLRQLVSHGGRLPTHDPSRGACRCSASERAPADSSGLLKGEIT